MKMYVFECIVCQIKDDSDGLPCYLMSDDETLFDETTYCPVDGESDANFKLVGTSRGINKLKTRR